MEKFRGKYKTQSNRLQTWDYASNAMYFITICTKNQLCFFGEIINGEMMLSEIGKIAESEWLKTFDMRPDMNLRMGEYVVMPNHFHGIITIGENQYNKGLNVLGDGGGIGRDAMHCVSTASSPNRAKNKFGPQSKNLASIVRGFKIGVTKNARTVHADFAWQPNYHEHIIRNNNSHQKISNYIINNPTQWNADKFNPINPNSDK
jgi:REP element-mobilizing transposase RayT